MIQSFRQFLDEGYKTGILLHLTSIRRLHDMLGDDRIRMNSGKSTATEAGFSRGKDYFLSTARHMHNLFYKTTTGIVAVIVLDRDAIKSRNKVVSVDFWGNGPKESEAEDRIISNRPYIDNFSKIVREIHIKYSNYGNSRWRLYNTKTRFRALHSVDMAVRKGIPVYIYNDEKAFMLLDKNKAMKPKEFIEGIKDIESKRIKSMDTERIRDAILADVFLKNIIDLYLGKDTPRNKRLRAELESNKIRAINIIHDNFIDAVSRASGPATSELQRLLMIMRRDKIETPSLFIKKVIKKYAAAKI